MNTDRVILSRAVGYNPQIIWSLSEEQRHKIEKKGTYEQMVFGALFGRTLPPHAQMSSWLPPVVEENHLCGQESDETRALRKLAQNIPDSPTSTLDMPNVANDYYRHSVAVCGKNAAVILGNECYLVLDIASRTRSIKKVFERNDPAYGLACIEWLNATTLAVGYQRSSELYRIDITGRQDPKCQTALHHIALGQLTRITRLSDTVFLTGYKNGEVVYNDTNTGESRSLLGMRRNPETVCSIVPSNRAKHVAIGYNDGSLNVYELTSEKTFALVRSYPSKIPAGKRALAWLPGSNTQFICGGGSTDPVLRLFTTQQDEAVASHTLPFPITNIVFTDKRQFAATYGNRIGHFVLWHDKITRIKEVVTSSNQRLLDAVYNPETGLLTSSAGEFLNIWPPIPPKRSLDKSDGMKILIR